MSQENLPFVPWRRYIFAVSQALITFTTCTFLLGLYIIHRGDSSLITIIAVGLVYASAVIFSFYKMFRTFAIPAIIITVPIAPLIIMGIVVSLIHVLQYFK
tara:strand:- start:581 stop:883 length:303 start_codon:yes stop_codon:yes gene_type:complete